MQQRSRFALVLLIASIPALIGGVWAWFASEGQVPGLRAIAPFFGASIALVITGMLISIAKAIAYPLGLGPKPRAVESDWRERSRLTEERQERYFAWLAKWAWAFALPLALLPSALFFAAGGDPVAVILSLVFMFVVLWFVVRLAARTGPKTLFPRQDRRAEHGGTKPADDQA